MNIYEVTSENIYKCNDCRKDMVNNFYMFKFARNKNNEITIYLCRECRDKLKWMLNAEY